MYSAAQGFTTFYLLLTMSLYTIFLTQMFLGIIVGHFETEWNLVNEMKGNNQESFNVAQVVKNIVKQYFKERVEEEQKKMTSDINKQRGGGSGGGAGGGKSSSS